MKLHMLAATVVAFALALTLAGCGPAAGKSGSENSGASTPANNGAPARPWNNDTPSPGVTDTEVVIGQPAAFSGPSAGLGVEMWRGAIAAFAEVNEAGGVHGRKIRLELADDGYEADRAVAAVNQLVNDKQVFCIGFSVGTPTMVRILEVLEPCFHDTGLFMFSNFTGAQAQRVAPHTQEVFNVRASYRQETAAVVDAFVKAGRKTIGMFIQADNYGADGREGARSALERYGLDVAVTTDYKRGQRFEQSTAAEVEKLKRAGVDAIIAVGAYQACAALIRDCRSSGWNVPIHNVSFVGADQMMALLKKEEASSGKRLVFNLINTQVVPFYDRTDVPLVVQYRAAIDRFKPGVPEGMGDVGGYRPTAAYSFGSLEGYVSARALIEGLKATGKTLTRGRFIAAVEAMGKFDLGLGVPCEFSPTHHQMLDTVWFTYADGTTYRWLPTQDPVSTLTD
ncbi:MAG: ABC transporter substrate-binding protein [Planctomycetota bacterium]